MADGIVIMIRCNLYYNSFLVCLYSQTGSTQRLGETLSLFLCVGYVADNLLILSDSICMLLLITPRDTHTHLLLLSPAQTKTIMTTATRLQSFKTRYFPRMLPTSALKNYAFFFFFNNMMYLRF